MIRIAHRGYSDVFGDNNIKSFRGAIDCGQFEMIEMDLQVDRTGTIVINHDLILDGSKEYLTFETFIHSIQVPSHMKVYLDLKGPIGIVHRLETFFTSHPELDMEQYIVCSFNLNHLRSFTLPFKKGFITDNVYSPRDLDVLLDDSMIYMVINWQSLDHTTIEYCHSKGVKVFTYTVDTMDQIQDFEVDGVVINKIF